MQLRVFLCHSTTDKPAVRALYKRLMADEVQPWFDEESLLPGQYWQQEIPKAVRNSDVVIVCLSHGAITREGYLQKEIKYALDVADEKPDGTIYVIPLRLEECQIPERLGLLQWVNLYEDNGYTRLMRALKARQQQIRENTAPSPILNAGNINTVSSTSGVKTSPESTNYGGLINKEQRTSVDADSASGASSFTQMKICMLGAFAVGKTSLVSQFVSSIFSDTYLTTVGVKTSKKTIKIGERVAKLIVWDIYGDDDFQSVRESDLKGASGYMLVVDGTRISSYKKSLELQKRFESILSSLPFVLVFNKSDLVEQWEISPNLQEDLRSKGVTVIQGSAKTGQGVEEAFRTLTLKMLDK